MNHFGVNSEFIRGDPVNGANASYYIIWRESWREQATHIEYKEYIKVTKCRVKMVTK